MWIFMMIGLVQELMRGLVPGFLPWMVPWLVCAFKWIFAPLDFLSGY